MDLNEQISKSFNSELKRLICLVTLVAIKLNLNERII